MAQTPPELLAHREWIGQIAPVGLVVSPQVLVTRGVFIDRQRAIVAQTRLAELVVDDEDERVGVDDPLAVLRDVLDWPDGLLAGAPGGPPISDELTVALPEYEDRLAPSYALRDPDDPAKWLLLVQQAATGADLDKTPGPDKHHDGWRASPHARFERLLRETGVPIGILFNGTSLRLIYAPRGESSGHLSFRLADLLQTQGRPMAGALCALLGIERVTDLQPEPQRLASLLRESRKYQNEVSTELADQVLEALWELVRGFQKANEDAKGELLAQALRESPNDVYGGLLSTLMRLVFILYAEDRTLMPQSDVYQRYYSLSGLFERLRDDQARYPDTMDARYGAWAQLLALFRLIHDGGAHGDLRFPSRHGRLFNPDAYPFLEGRPQGSARQKGQSIDPPRVSDGVVFRVLRNLLVLDGERLSYRALDVEQIGSVYEAMMGFALEQAAGPSIALTPKHIVVNLSELLEVKPKERIGWLREHSELKLKADALAKATSADELVTALGKKASRHTPHVLSVGALYLQPTEERRRSGSHYTPRALTQPIVSATFRPIFERLGDTATPEQILDLKVCDPAMGSGAFLVEACRLLADKLARAWEVHKQTPKVPDDEDVLTFARRLVAERCLYGLDKNVFAVDLAKLSLWLATLAREHPFTFLDHALRHGDSLVGLSHEQIASFNWDVGTQMPLLRSLIDERVGEAQRLREQIQGLATSDDVPAKEHLLRDAEGALADVRLIGDLVVSAFFERDKHRERQTLRAAYAGQVEQSLSKTVSLAESSQAVNPTSLALIATSLRAGDQSIWPFHWSIEFPEIFRRGNGGFDVFVGNPPFIGGGKISGRLGPAYRDWLLALHVGAHGNADIVAHFFRRAFGLLRREGTFGLIATNTIAQGDTRTTGLTWICNHGGTVYEARKRLRWPGTAAVIVSVVQAAKEVSVAPTFLDGNRVQRITAFLLSRGPNEQPATMTANKDISFLGTKVYGQGFLFDDLDPKASPLNVMQALLRQNPRNGEMILPFIGGEEVNDNPVHEHHRYAISFGQRTEEEARQWPELMAIVEHKVRPERARNNREGYRRYWWQHGERRVELYRKISDLTNVLVTCQTSKFRLFARLNARQIFDQKLVVYALDSWAMFAILQSRVHEHWAGVFGSTLEDRPVYTPTDCFETFPLPSGWITNHKLQETGQSYYQFRSELMVRNNEGLTETYNRFNDPAELHAHFAHLRELHHAIDLAVLDAYGWTDLQPLSEFVLDYEDEQDEVPGKASKRRKPYRYRWPDDVRDEVLGRLLELNSSRAKEELLAGPSKEESGRRSKKARSSSRQTPLLG